MIEGEKIIILLTEFDEFVNTVVITQHQLSLI